MKKQKILIVAGFISVLMLGMVGTVMAKRPPSPPAGSNFAQRLARRKAEIKPKLDEKTVKRLEKQCTEAQGILNGSQQSLNQTINRRNSEYVRIEGKVWLAIGQLKLGNKDTFELEKLRTEYEKLTDEFKTLTAEYAQTIDDIVVINCPADVTGFKALLESARAYHEEIRNQSTKIRQHVVDKIKPAIKKHEAGV